MKTLVHAAVVSLTLVALGCAGAQKPAAVIPDSASTARIMGRLSALSADSMEGRLAGTAGGKRARAWIIRELTAIGVKPLGASFEHPVKLAVRPNADTLGANIVARIPGKRSGGPTLVLSAHYDHLGVRNGAIYNGADDDASGCVALLTIAERLLREQPEHDVVLAFFDAEEGGLRGARAFVAEGTVPLSQVALNINLDMVSRQDNNAVWVAGLSHYPGLRALAEGAGKRARIPVKFGHDTKGVKPSDDWTSASDHGAFHAKAIPFLYLGVEDHPDYHGPGDDASKVDPAFYSAVIDFAHDLVKSADAQLAQLMVRRGK
jgi:hypothetical protein